MWAGTTQATTEGADRDVATLGLGAAIECSRRWLALHGMCLALACLPVCTLGKTLHGATSSCLGPVTAVKYLRNMPSNCQTGSVRWSMGRARVQTVSGKSSQMREMQGCEMHGMQVLSFAGWSLSRLRPPYSPGPQREAHEARHCLLYCFWSGRWCLCISVNVCSS